ncbi:MAG: cobalamin-dependent protein [Chloroflexota bacterium]|nr:cobalamin-dependent protein [Chloroflexota bacterium]
MTGRIRVLIAKPGLDGHELGAIVVAKGLRDAGMEVVYTGLHQTSEQIVASAIQEDVDVIGTSIYSGAYLVLMNQISKLIKEKVPVDKKFLLIVGGPIPPADVPKLKEIGVDEVFSSHSKIEEIVQFIKSHAPSKTVL